MSTFINGGNVHANGIRQHYLRYGGDQDGRKDRDTVIIIPGITSPAVTWGFVAERLGQHLDTYVLDVRGRGLSENSNGIDYGVDAQAVDVIAFCETMGIGRFSVVGHSMGARIGARMARQRPKGMRRLVMIDPPVSGPGRRPYPSKLNWYVDSIRSALRGMSTEEMRRYCPTWTDEQLSLRAEWLHTCNETAIVRSFNDFHEDDFHADLSHMEVPVLLMVAERGGVIEAQDVKEMQQLIPDLDIAYIEEAGHMIPWDNEPGFYKGFGSFLGLAIE